MNLEALLGVLKTPIVTIFIVCIIADTVFGVLRALKQKTFNSAFGIDGAIRKLAMLLGIAFLVVIDGVTGFNLIGWLPTEIVKTFGLTTVGLTDFFALLFIVYEAISVVKNLKLCGVWLPAFIDKFLEDLLKKYTNELPQHAEEDTD